MSQPMRINVETIDLDLSETTWKISNDAQMWRTAGHHLHRQKNLSMRKMVVSRPYKDKDKDNKKQIPQQQEREAA